MLRMQGGSGPKNDTRTLLGDPNLELKHNPNQNYNQHPHPNSNLKQTLRVHHHI